MSDPVRLPRQSSRNLRGRRSQSSAAAIGGGNALLAAPDLEGVLRRRKANRVGAGWVERYFTLRGATLEYFNKAGDVTPKKTVLLDSGCVVGPVEEVKAGSRALYAFRITWPKQVDADAQQLSDAGADSSDAGGDAAMPASPLSAPASPLPALSEGEARGGDDRGVGGTGGGGGGAGEESHSRRGGPSRRLHALALCAPWQLRGSSDRHALSIWKAAQKQRKRVFSKASSHIAAAVTTPRAAGSNASAALPPATPALTAAGSGGSGGGGSGDGGAAAAAEGGAAATAAGGVQGTPFVERNKTLQQMLRNEAAPRRRLRSATLQPVIVLVNEMGAAGLRLRKGAAAAPLLAMLQCTFAQRDEQRALARDEQRALAALLLERKSNAEEPDEGSDAEDTSSDAEVEESDEASEAEVEESARAVAEAKLKERLATGVTAGVGAAVAVGLLTAGVGLVAVVPLVVGVAGTAHAGGMGYLEYKKRAMTWNKAPLILGSGDQEAAERWHAAISAAVAAAAAAAAADAREGSGGGGGELASPLGRGGAQGGGRGGGGWQGTGILSRGEAMTAQPAPALPVTDLAAVATLLACACWRCCTMLQGVRIFAELPRHLAAGAACSSSGSGSSSGASAVASATTAMCAWLPGWRQWCPTAALRGGRRRGRPLAARAPMLRCQVLVRASPLETLTALSAAALVLVRASPLETLMALLAGQELSDGGEARHPTLPASAEAGVVALGIRVLETLDDNTDVIEYLAASVRLGPLAWAGPRQFCMARHWREDSDGCYVVCMDSTPHRLCPPPPPGFVRGTMNALFTIAPRREASMPLTGISTPECMLTHFLRVDPGGWVWRWGGYQQHYGAQLLLQAIDIRDIIEEETFHSPRLHLQAIDIRDRFEEETFHSPRLHLQAIDILGIIKEETFHSPRLHLQTAAAAAPAAHAGAHAETAAAAALLPPPPLRPRSAAAGILDAEPCCPPHMWSDIDASAFSLRGATYLADRVKAASAPRMFDLRAIDLWQFHPHAIDLWQVRNAAAAAGWVKEPTFNITSNMYNRIQRALMLTSTSMLKLHAVAPSVEEPTFHITSHKNNRIQRARAAGDTTFVWAVQIMVPGPPHIACVAYFTPRDEAALSASDTPFGRLTQRVLLSGDAAALDARLKLVPRITEGNWVVRRACPPTPAILGAKLRQAHFRGDRCGTRLRQAHFRGDRYLETSVDIGSSSIAASITRLSIGYAKTLVVELAWTLQGEAEDELPEVILGGFRMVHLDMATAQPYVGEPPETPAPGADAAPAAVTAPPGAAAAAATAPVAV
ncbi:hypothetical protein JKP88DRAFT_353873 [Tribonema minus]|uniref:START domain-containing protein n=1 Tax=Tribonema minus TaxID=303371 RepID=A0A835Z631_9STRA|nr:hypothetical protein JKP88DRAFT_353873 [Tribonema minus]